MKWTKFNKTEAKSKVLNVRITPSHAEKLRRILKFVKKTDESLSQSDLIQNFIDVAYEEIKRKSR